MSRSDREKADRINERLSNGEITLDQARKEFGLNQNYQTTKIHSSTSKIRRR